jgi:hypothetical protein
MIERVYNENESSLSLNQRDIKYMETYVKDQLFNDCIFTIHLQR